MKQVLEQLDGLRSFSGNQQIDYLFCVKNDLLKDVLTYALDTHRKYKIDEGKYDKCNVSLFFPNGVPHLTVSDWEQFKTILDELADMKSAKDKDVERVKTFICNFQESDFLRMVLFKDLRINMAAKKIQKVWPDFCVTYPYMGCRPYNQKNIEAMTYPAFGQTKMDGSFCNVILDLTTGKCEYVSRQSKPQPMKGSLDSEFINVIPNIPQEYGTKITLTGEALVWDNENNKPLPRKISNGILRRENKTPEELASIHFVCWDMIPYDKFVAKKWNVPYKIRFENMKSLFGNCERIHLVNTWVVNNLSEAMALFEEQYAKGEEGIIVKAFDQIWQDGKPAGQVKIKAEKSCELTMVNFLEGKGNYAGMCGSIICISKDNDLEVNVKPRTPADAQELWDNVDKYVGRILEVKFNEVIESDTKDKPSLYLPVFVEIRDDKSEADTLEYIRSL